MNPAFVIFEWKDRVEVRATLMTDFDWLVRTYHLVWPARRFLT